MATKGKPARDVQVVHRPITGPTPERLQHADGAFTIGDDKRGGRIYHFVDTTMDRLYSRLTKAAKTIADEEELRKEYIGLQRYKHHWYHAGLVPGVRSVDPNRIFAADPLGMSGMAKSERQAHHRQQYRDARALLGHQQGIVVDNVVCSENSLEVAGYAIGWTSKPQAISAATTILRDAGERLAKMWGVG